MTAYRLFFLNHPKKITHAEPLDARDDIGAISLAQAAPFDAIDSSRDLKGEMAETCMSGRR